MRACPRTRRISSLHLILTTECNARCRYCYQRHTALRMGRETLRLAMDWARRASRPEIEIVFSGGEPLLSWPLLVRAVRDYAGNVGPRDHRALAPRPRFILLTNGLLLDPEKIGFLVEHRFDLQISFDGIPPAQATRAAGSFRILDRLLDSLLNGYGGYWREHLTIAITLTPRNLPHLSDSCAHFLGKRVPEIAIAPALGRAGGWDPGRIDEMQKQFDRLSRKALAHLRQWGEIPLAFLCGTGSGPCERQADGPLCGAFQGLTPAVGPDGRVYGCPFFAEPILADSSVWFREEARRLAICNLHERGFPMRFAAWTRRASRNRFVTSRGGLHSPYGPCAECPSRSECSPCPASIGLAPDSDDPDLIPAFYCAFIQVSSRTRLRFRRQAGKAALEAEARSRAADPLARFLGRPGLPSPMERVKAFGDTQRR